MIIVITIIRIIRRMTSGNWKWYISIYLYIEISLLLIKMYEIPMGPNQNMVRTDGTSLLGVLIYAVLATYRWDLFEN